MKMQEWNEGLSHVSPDLVEKYVERKERAARRRGRQRQWIRIGALAACVALIVCAIAVPLAQRGGENGGRRIPYTPVMLNAANPQEVSGSNLAFAVGTSVPSVGYECPPAFDFDGGPFAVVARAVDHSPDVYYKPDGHPDYPPAAYRLIEMETVEVLRGEGIPKRFFYLLPDPLFEDMSVYDALVISMVQLGAENYVLRNETKKQMEALALPVFADIEDHPDLGNVMAFTSGVFDEGLWQSPAWRYGYQFGQFYLSNPEQSSHVVERGDSLEDVIAKIRGRFGNARVCEAVSLSDRFQAQEALDALEYVKPFENGVFSQSIQTLQGKTTVVFRRYVNGCRTDETVTVDLETEEVTYSAVRYTEQDVARMENIAVYLARMAQEYAENPPRPPHVAPEGKQLLSLHLYAWYVKAEGKQYGIIRTVWWYREPGSTSEEGDFYDDAYILYDMEAHIAMAMEREALEKIIGTRWHIFS